MRAGLSARRGVVALLAGVVVPLAVAAVLVPFRASFADTAAALVLVAVVVAVAVAGDRIAGVVATVSASIWFDFFLTRPYERFTISQRPEIETTVSLFVVGLAVTELAVRNRRHAAAADERLDFVAVIYGLAELVTSGAKPAEVIDRAILELTELLQLRACRFETGHVRQQRPRIEHSGEVVEGHTVWDERAIARDGAELELSVESAGQHFGWFVLSPTPGVPLSVARRLVAVAVADQVGAVLAEHRRSA